MADDLINAQMLQVQYAVEFDQASAQKAAQGVRNLGAEVARVEADVQKAAAEVAAAREPDSVQAVRARVSAKQQEIVALQQEAAARRGVAEAARVQGQNELDELRGAASRPKNRYDNLTDTFAGGSAGGEESVGSAGNNAAGALRTLGQILPGTAGNAARTAGELARLNEQFPKLVGGMGSLAEAAGPAAGALIAISIAFDAFKKKLDEAQKTLDEAVQRQVDYYQTIETSTSEQIKAQIKAKQIEADSYERTAKQIDEATSRLDFFGKAIVTLLGVLGKGPVKEFDDLTGKANKAQADIDALNEALGSSEVKANDAAEAQKKSAQEAEKAAKKQEQEAERAAKTQAKEAEKAADAQIKAAEKAAEEVGRLYASIIEKTKQFKDQSLKLEVDRQKSLNDLALRESQQAEDRKRQEVRDAARDARKQAFDAQKLGADREFGALADARDQAAFDKNEAQIKAKEDAEDRSVQHARDVASIEQRVADARVAAAATELDTMRQVVAEFAKLKGGYGDPRYYSDSQIKSVYGAAAGQAGAGYPALDPSKVKFDVQKLGFDPATKHRAGGGWLNPGEWSTVNELPGQREGFGGAMLPSGRGLFFPMQGGNVTTNHNSRGNTTIIVNESRTPQMTWREIERKLNERDDDTY
jgi:hypothetical protein